MDVAIPQLGVSMTEGTIAEWLVADGAVVAEGQVLYLLETDKTETEIPSPAAGTIQLLAQAGVTYLVGTVVARLS